MDKKERQRLEVANMAALSGQDALAYYRTCQELGIEPVDQELFELGNFEKQGGYKPPEEPSAPRETLPSIKSLEISLGSASIDFNSLLKKLTPKLNSGTTIDGLVTYLKGNREVGTGYPVMGIYQFCGERADLQLGVWPEDEEFSPADVLRNLISMLEAEIKPFQIRPGRIQENKQAISILPYKDSIYNYQAFYEKAKEFEGAALDEKTAEKIALIQEFFLDKIEKDQRLLKSLEKPDLVGFLFNGYLRQAKKNLKRESEKII